MFHRLRHRLLGDGVEDHAFDRLSLECFLFFEHFQHVPGDCFTLAVRVGGEDQLVGVLELSRNVINALVRFGIDFPQHAKIGFGIDGAILGGEVANMTKRSQYLIA